MNCESVRELMLDAADGTQDRGLAASVKSHINACASCRREAEVAGEMWSLLGGLHCAPPGAGMSARFVAMVTREAVSAARREDEGGTTETGWLDRVLPVRPALQILVTLAAVIVGVGFGIGVGAWAPKSEIRLLRQEMRSMLDVASLSLLDHQSASERLRAVRFSEASSLDENVVAALLGTIRNDPSVNVRLAALDVLASLASRTDVRSGLMEALPRQESPAMQVALAEVLLEMDGRESRRETLQMLERTRVPESVRHYLLEILAEEDLDT